VLDAFAEALHRVQVRQLVPDVEIESDAIDIDALSTHLRPELVQLWYQMALNARRDLALAPSARAGFEMAMLRMLAFRPGQAAGMPADSGTASKVTDAASARAALSGAGKPETKTQTPPAAASPPSAPPVATTAIPAVSASANDAIDAERWLELVAGSGLRGPARELAAHAGFVGYADGVLRLSLSPADEHLKMPNLVKALADALAPPLGSAPQVRFEAAALAAETLHQRSARERDARQVAAEASFIADPGVQQLMQRHGATLVPDSIRPFDE